MATIYESPSVSCYTVFKPHKTHNTLHSSHHCITIPTSKRLKNIRASSVAEQDTVTVPVSPSDVLTMFFQAEGTMSEAAIPSVTSAIEETEGISNLKVQVLEGIASVELKKKTTVQATGVASGLVEIMQNSGFKLQALNLSFDEDDN